jgi:acyl transferase domain-containing protein
MGSRGLTDVHEDWTDVLLLSAESSDGLEAIAAAYAPYLRAAKPSEWRNIRATLAWRCPTLSHRLVVAGSTPKAAAERLAQHVAGDRTSRVARGKAPPRRARLALVYSGNGPQWWGMGRELFAQSKIFSQAIEEIDALLAPKSGWSLVEEMRRPESDNRIGLIEIAQPLLFAQQVALTQVLSAAGLQADAVIGHSVGEVAAAWTAGTLTLEQAVEVIFQRSQLQALTAGDGRMAALGVGVEDAQRAMADIDGWLEIAAINSPRAVTVAGALPGLQILSDRLADAGKFVRILPLNYAFHSRAMDAIQRPLLQRLQGLSPKAGRIPFLSTVAGAEIDGADLGANYWWRNVRAPVLFEATVAHAVQDHDIGLFLEVGPHPVLKDYLQQIIRAADGGAATVLSTLRRPAPGRPAPELDTLKTAVCSVYACGGGDLKALIGKPATAVKLPTLD